MGSLGKDWFVARRRDSLWPDEAAEFGMRMLMMVNRMVVVMAMVMAMGMMAMMVAIVMATLMAIII